MAEGEVKPDQRKLRVLRAVVIILGLAIVGAFTLMIVFSVQKLMNKPEGVAPAAFDLGLPEGAVIKDYSIEGSRMAVRVQTPSGEEIVIVDTDKGRILGIVRATPARRRPRMAALAKRSRFAAS
jgi:hypothetical protein